MKKIWVVCILCISSWGWAKPMNKTTLQAEEFLRFYQSLYGGLGRVSQEAQWRASTDVSEKHDGERTAANTALAAFSGDRHIVTTTKQLLSRRKELPPLMVRQLEKILLAAAEGPGTIPDVVSARVAAESHQSSMMDGFTFHLDGQPVTANQIDEILHTATDLKKRQAAWEASKEIGKPLRPGLEKLQKLRNQVASEMGHPSYFALQVADYDMTEPEMMKLLQGFLDDTRPLYQKLHAWVRQKLAAKYKQPIPKRIPAHWLPNRWGQEWSGIVDGAVDYDPLFRGKKASWIVESAEQFWVSLGFPKLPASFWQKSDLYPLAADAPRKKNAHASCWHIDLDSDIRSLMSVEPNAWWFRTAHHELGHAYYFISYSRPEVPLILRQGANRAMHEAMGDLAAIAATQPKYLQEVGLLSASEKIDQRAALIEEALESAIPFLAWSAGTIAHFEHDLYSEKLPASEWQKRWWKYAGEYQGIEPPSPRPEDGCDACSKTHINDLPAQYYNYALSAVMKYQLHDHICQKILHQDPHQCSYLGHKEVGDFLRKIMEQGATRPWTEVLKEATGEPLSTRALMSYFQPLDSYLNEQTRGQKLGW